jgi:hypothetical protein
MNEKIQGTDKGKCKETCLCREHYIGVKGIYTLKGCVNRSPNISTESERCGTECYEYNNNCVVECANGFNDSNDGMYIEVECEDVTWV